MDVSGLVIGLAIAGAIVGYIVSAFVGKKVAANKIVEAEQKAKAKLEDADRAASNLQKEKMLEAKEEWHKRKQEFEKETQAKRAKLEVLETQIQAREEGIENKLDIILKKEKNLHNFEQDLNKRDKSIAEKQNQIESLFKEQVAKLENISGLSSEDARKQLIQDMVNEAKSEASKKVVQIREEAKMRATREAQNIIVQAIQRTASDHCVETTVSVVNLESDEMKGRIIGREGRNIRAFEAATGIDLIIDDTPEAVVISGFDPFRREVAKKALGLLMQDGRIHPTRIEEVVKKAEKELDDEMIQVGEATLLELGLHNMRAELVRYIGKMKYRSSYGQNLLSHSIEVSYLCGIMALELGLDVNTAKRAALLHDIGKCVDRELEGPHALLGMELAKKNKENHIVCNAIGAHHEDIEMESPIAVLVQAADSISGARPGARRESIENYVKRLETLENIAMSYPGVEKTFAIQAGRDVRVIVEPAKINDAEADQLAEDIAKRIEQEMEYPGQIKVTVIRERRSFAIAK